MFICHVSVRVSDWLVVSHVIEEALWLRWRVLLTNHNPWMLKQETVQNIKQLAVIVFHLQTNVNDIIDASGIIKVVLMWRCNAMTSFLQ